MIVLAQSEYKNLVNELRDAKLLEAELTDTIVRLIVDRVNLIQLVKHLSKGEINYANANK